MPRKALGKGLEALFPTYQEKTNEEIHEISVEDIFPNRQQPRQRFDNQKLEELAASIKTHGIIQPIFLKRHVHGYEIIVGERRWRAAKLAGLTKIPAIIRDVSEDKKLEIALIENIQRENLNPIEEGQAYKMLLDDFSFTQQTLAEKIGKDRSTISNMIRLLKLPDKIKENIAIGTLTMGHARSILSLETEKQQISAFEKIIKKGLSVRETEAFVKKISSDLKMEEDGNKVKAQKDTNFIEFENQLSKHFSAKVKIQYKNEKGRIEIYFSNKDDINRIFDLLNFSIDLKNSKLKKDPSDQ